MKKLAQKEWLAKAKANHGNDYDYSLSEYVSAHTPIKVICNTCKNILLVDPITHANSKNHRCPYCHKRSCTLEEWKQKANKVHNNYYDYSKVKYINNHTKVCIICKKHGEFWQNAGYHLHNHGCPECAKEKSRLTQEEFIEKCKSIYGEQFTYEKTKYVNARTPFIITCRIHGNLEKDYNHFITRRQGCSLCNKDKKLELKVNLKEYDGKNYKEEYDKLISYAKRQKRVKGKEYYEIHHIIPRSLGGSNNKDNLVLLTPEEHFKAHYLLWKFTHSPEMTNAFWCFVIMSKKEILTPEEYAKLRKEASKRKAECKS